MRISGITLFGCPDFGGENVQHATVGYLDSGYLRLLFTFGAIPFVIVIAALCVLGYGLAIRGERFLVLCVVIVLLRSVIDGGFVYLQETPIYFYLLYCLRCGGVKKSLDKQQVMSGLCFDWHKHNQVGAEPTKCNVF